jgi:hypothetical protein
MENTFIEFEPNDFIIRISPTTDSEGTWTGDIDVGMLTIDENTLNKNDFDHLNVLTQMLISTIEVIETDPQVRSKIFNAVPAEVLNNRPTIKKREGNIIKVNF